MRCWKFVWFGLLNLALSGMVQAESFSWKVSEDTNRTFTVPPCDSALIEISGDGSDARITIDASAVRGRVVISFKCDLEDAKITIKLPAVAERMQISFTKDVDLEDATVEIFAPLPEKDQPVVINNNAKDDEDAQISVIR